MGRQKEINSGLAFVLSMINGGFFLKPSSLRKTDYIKSSLKQKRRKDL